MKYKEKTKAQRVDELTSLHSRVQAALEESYKALQESEARYRNFVENAIDSCLEYDLDGICTFCNESAYTNLGYSREEYMRIRHHERYVSKADADKVLAAVKEVYRTGVPAKIIAAKIICKDGRPKIYEAMVSLVYGTTGKPVGFRCIARDITQRKELEAEQERYKNFVDNISDGCFEFDLAGQLTFCNEGFLRIFGYTREEMMTLSRWERHISQEDAKKIFRMYEEMYRKDISFKILEYAIVRSDGEVRDFEASVSLIRNSEGKTVGFRGICRDITERKKSEVEQERYRNFIENIEDGCFESDLAGYSTFSNEAVKKIMGYSQEELAQMNVTGYSEPEEAKRITQIFNNIYLTGVPAKMYDQTIIRKDGEIRTLNASASLIRHASGKPVGFRGIVRDVTEQKSMESEREKMRGQLTKSQKMEAIGTLAGGIAHDFNNLLMGIQGYVSLMLLDTNPSHPHYERLKTIETQVQSGADLTRQLLGFARGGRYEIKPTNINELVSRTANIFGRTKKEISIHQKYAGDIPSVEVDRIQIEQVLLNLFVNAWQAMPSGGSIYLETTNVFLDESYVKLFEIKPGPYVKISVADTGMGMDAKVKERVFEPFFTTKEMGRGAGLGLASAYGIIKGHNGLIDVKSERGQGTMFSIYLPVSDKKVVSQEKPAGKTVRGKETVLIVDDEKIITDVTGEMLSELGYKVLTAPSGEEAVDIYRDNKDEIDLVIMDMIMPGIGGGEAFDRIMALNSQARVILSSGYSLTGHAKKIMSRGARAFLQKPFHLEELSQKVREVLER
jgi:PAS domain S-box-containing protein